MLLDLQRFLEPPPEDLPREGVVDFEAEAEWRSLREKLGPLKEPSQGGQGPGPEPFRRTRPMKAALAAVLAVAVVGLVIYILRYRHDPNPAVVEAIFVASVSSTRGESGPEKVVPIHSGQEAKVPLILEAGREPSSPRYRLEVRRRNSDEVLYSEDVKRGASGFFTWALSPDALADGRYEVTVNGLGAGEPQRAGLYRLKIVHR